MKAYLCGRPAAMRFGAFAGLLLVVPMFGQQTAGNVARTADSVTIQLLLEEVRQMRVALERYGLILPRLQLASQRVQLQQDRLDRMSRELQELRVQMAQHASERDRLVSMVKELESEAGQSSDPSRRKEMEAISRKMTGELERQNSRMQQERTLEMDLSLRFKAEEARLQELSSQVETWERELDRRAGNGSGSQ
jgi:division protein CdvB (Snf7/Vps24/ESCRT-III family)